MGRASQPRTDALHHSGLNAILLYGVLQDIANVFAKAYGSEGKSNNG